MGLAVLRLRFVWLTCTILSRLFPVLVVLALYPTVLVVLAQVLSYRRGYGSKGPKSKSGWNGSWAGSKTHSKSTSTPLQLRLEVLLYMYSWRRAEQKFHSLNF